MKKIYHLFLFVILISKHTFGFVPTLTSKLETVKWQSQIVEINLNTSSNINDPDSIYNIVDDAISQWRNASTLNLSLKNTSDFDVDKQSEIYFSNDPKIFGSGVVGVTFVAYQNNTGAIEEADIILNENIGITTNQDSKLYLGNVVAHELGHFLGLAHEPTLESTMFYQAERGQFKLSNVDVHSAKNLYDKSSSLSTITGKIVGGANLTPVFGTQVLLFNNLGELIATTISNAFGGFTFKAIDPNAKYYVYTRPLKFKNTLPSFYLDSRSNFCENGEHYRGSFFQSCLRNEEGFPQSITPTANSVTNLGNISIRCGLDVPPAYLNAKDQAGVYNLPVDRNNLSMSYVGYFSNTETEAELEDVVRYIVPSSTDIGTNGPIEINISLRSQIFYSIYKPNLSIYKNGIKVFGKSTTHSDLKIMDDFSLNLDQSQALDVIPGDSLEFRVKARNWFEYLDLEENVSPYRQNGRRNFSTSDFFPDFLVSSFDYKLLYSYEQRYYTNSMGLKDSINLYWLSVNAKNKTTNELMKPKIFSNTDNTQCLDAPRTYVTKRASEVSNSVNASKSNQSKNDDQGALACGSVGDIGGNNPPSNGIFQVFLGFLAIISIKKSFNRHKV